MHLLGISLSDTRPNIFHLKWMETKAQVESLIFSTSKLTYSAREAKYPKTFPDNTKNSQINPWTTKISYWHANIAPISKTEERNMKNLKQLRSSFINCPNYRKTLLNWENAQGFREFLSFSTKQSRPSLINFLQLSQTKTH